MAVFVLGKDKKPLMPCTEKRARLLLERGRAIVHKMEPFTIRLKDRKQKDCELQPLRLKLDPGSKTTGFAVLLEKSETEANTIVLGELHHKQGIKDNLKSRSDRRKNRRNRNLRYREERFLNRTRPKGWLAPSLKARVEQTNSFINKARKLMPITSLTQELVKFDTQKMENPDIKGVEYQQGTLMGYEVREYLLEKWDRKCAYCEKTDVPFEVEHVIAKSRGGTDRISNLTIACHDCNDDKGSLLPNEWIGKLEKRSKPIDLIRLKNIPKVLLGLKVPLKDAAAVNTTRNALFKSLQLTGLPVETGTGALTKMQRIQKELPKEHYYDASCAGESTPEVLNFKTDYVLVWEANGRGSRQMARVDQYGFPLNHQDKILYDKDGNRKGHRQRKKQCHGFQTGDLIIAHVTKGKKIGTYRGRVAIRHSGSFNIKDSLSGTTIQGISWKYCKLIQRNDGWTYSKTIRNKD